MGILEFGIHALVLAGPLALFAEPSAMTSLTPALVLVGLALLAASTESRVFGGRSEVLAPGAARRSALASGILLLFTYWLSGLAGMQPGKGELGALLVIGVLLMVFGMFLRASAILNLGAAFQSRAGLWPTEKLVESGIHRFVRHPSETGLILLALGAAVIGQSLPALALTGLGLVPLGVFRAREEDRALASAFGPVHHRYRQRVRAFVPGLF
jgi:protein-S-isoprenylcysteine O-methyltransferase Ste14